MSLPTLTYRQTGKTAVASTYLAQHFLAALQTVLAAVTYDNGDTRTPGTGRAWTVDSADGSPVEALVIKPPTDSPIAGFRGLVCGRASANSPTMAFGDTSQTELVYGGIDPIGSTGSYSAGNWTGANPFGTAGSRYSGLARYLLTSESPRQVWVIESAEHLVVVTECNGGEVYAMGFGAPIEPYVSANGENSGRLYGIWTQGTAGTSGISSTLWAQTTTNKLLGHSTTSNACHFGYSPIAGGALVNIDRPVFASSTGMGHDMGGSVGVFEIPLYQQATPFRRVGTTRGFGVSKQGRAREVVQENGAGTDSAYLLGYATASDGDCIGFRAA